MIRTTLIRRWGAASERLRRNPVRSARPAPLGAGRPARTLADEGGFTLIEVILSALMVGFIAIATFTGFTNAGHEAAAERFHNEAAMLAAQSQEALRSDSASTLNELASHGSHSYAQTVAHEKYTITESAVWVQDSSQIATCKSNAKETGGKQNVNYLKITSSVTWAQRPAAELPVSESSIITPPDGSSLEVEVNNGAAPEQPVAGVTAIANGISLVTGEAGCVIFGAIPSTVASVEAYKIDDVTPSGAWRKLSKELVITPNITTHYPVTLAPGGSITAEFERKGAPAEADTFVVANNQMGEAPEFEVGSNEFKFEAPTEMEGDYLPVTGVYKSTAETPIYKRYPNGNLFPFEHSNWVVYAGDCPANNPNSYGVKPAETLVTGGPATTSVKVHTSYVTLAIYEGSYANHTTPLTSTVEPFEVVIKNTGCTSEKTPNNAYGTNLSHTQKVKSGSLEHPFQPFGQAELYLHDKAKNKTYRIKYTNTTEEGSVVNIYLGENDAKDKRTKEAEEEAAQRKAAETTESTKQTARTTEATTEKNTKTADEAAEKTKQKKREEEATTEKNTKTADEAAEKTKQEKREKEAKEEKERREKLENEIKTTKSKNQKESKEKELTKLIKEEKENQEKREKEATKEKEEREKREKEEKTKQEKRAKEEAEEKASREAREKEEKTKQEKRAKEEKEEKEAREKREKEEKEKQKKREEEEKKEQETGKSEEVVESGA